MASGLPDAIGKLALKAEQSENEQGASLSKYFGQPDNTDDIFDTIVKPSRSADIETKINLFKSPTPTKEEVHQNCPPTFAFKKGEKESEPRIFSYFSQPSSCIAGELNKSADASEFFDQMSHLASKSQEPIEITNSGLQLSLERTNPSKTCMQVVSVAESISLPCLHNREANILAGLKQSTPVSSNSASNSLNGTYNISSSENRCAFTSQPVAPGIDNQTDLLMKTWSDSQERASNWWIPNKEIRLWLQSPSSLAEAFHLSYPGLLNSSELTDPMKDLLRHFDGEAAAIERQTLTIDMVSQDTRGLRDLIKAGCFRAAANLCGRLLTACGQGYGKAGNLSKHTPHSLHLWMTRLALLKKCDLLEIAIKELALFGELDSPDFYYEYYPELSDQKKRGTMVPFTFRLLAAELPAHHNCVNEAHMKLCQLLSTVRRIVRNIDQFAASEKMNESERREAANLWSQRKTAVLQSLINCSLMKKDFHSVVRLFHKQLLWPDHPLNPTLYSALGRVYLQIGDVPLAQQAFNCAVDLRDVAKPSDTVESLIDAGLVAIAQNAFVEALKYFQQALALQPDNPALVNNTAVCLLYVGRMRDGMLLLEENLGTKPETMIRYDTVLNVCTLYELESSLTLQRKLGMLRLASQWKNDDLSVSSFKLQAK